MKSQVRNHTGHVTRHIIPAFGMRQNASFFHPPALWVTRKSHVTRHTSIATRHTSHVACHTTHVTETDRVHRTAQSLAHAARISLEQQLRRQLSTQCCENDECKRMYTGATHGTCTQGHQASAATEFRCKRRAHAPECRVRRRESHVVRKTRHQLVTQQQLHLIRTQVAVARANAHDVSWEECGV
jgi:hypothetical protein